MYQIIESDGLNKKSIGYFNDLKEAREFIFIKAKEFKKKGYYVHNIKRKYTKNKQYKFYLGLRKSKTNYISWTIIKITNLDELNFTLTSSDLFGKLYPKKRTEQICLRVSKEELEILRKIAETFKVKPADILRTGIISTFSKQIKKIKGISNGI